MNIPKNLKYTQDHEWVRIEGNIATIGITDYAQDQLGDIVYVELPDLNQEFEKGNIFGVVESTKSVSDLFVPLSGKVLEINHALLDTPETVNESPYENAWMIKIEISDANQVSQLLDAAAYEKLLAEENV